MPHADAADGERLHRASFVVDLHAHGPGFMGPPFGAAWRALTPGAPREAGFGRLRDAGVGAVVAAAVGDPVVTRTHLGRDPWRAVEVQLSRIERQAASAGAVVVGSVQELAAARTSGRPAVLLGVEGADALGHDLDRLDAWYGRGVRVLTLVHLGDNALGTTSLPWQHYVGPWPRTRRARPGLTAYGTRVVRRMNELGLLVDVAHADEATLLAVVDAATAPVVASHSGARALQDFPRYLTDAELRAVAGTGGLVGLWPFRSRRTGVRDVAALVAHARHVAATVGSEHLALGTDTNGVPGVMAGYRGVADLPTVTGGLLDAGFSETEVRGILGGNALRVLRRVEEFRSR